MQYNFGENKDGRLLNLKKDNSFNSISPICEKGTLIIEVHDTGIGIS